MSRAELEEYVHDTNTSQTTEDPEGNDDELEALGIIPSEANKPKTDLVEPGAIELFYVGYLKDSMGAINALAAFMEVKSVSMLAQIEQQSYRIKALKTYLKMLEIALQELNKSYEGDKVATSEGNKTYTKAYLAIKYAAANQTRTLATIELNGKKEDYIVLQVDEKAKSGNYKHYNLSDNNAYIYVKATEAGIKEFLELQWDAVDMLFKSQSDPSFKGLEPHQIKDGYTNKTIFGNEPTFSEKLTDYEYLYKTAKPSKYYTIDIERYSDGIINRYQRDGDHYINTRAQTPWLYEADTHTEDHRLLYNPDLGWSKAGIDFYYIYYYKKTHGSNIALTSTNDNILFAKFDDNDQAIKELPKELETVKVSMNSILNDNYGGVGMSWKNKNDKENKYKNQWRTLVDQWQNVCQTATENIGSQIESVNKTIKSLRSKIDTFDSSANRFRDKFYSTTMTVLNKLS